MAVGASPGLQAHSSANERNGGGEHAIGSVESRWKIQDRKETETERKEGEGGSFEKWYNLPVPNTTKKRDKDIGEIADARTVNQQTPFSSTIQGSAQRWTR